METRELIRRYVLNLATADEVNELMQRMLSDDISETFAQVMQEQWEYSEDVDQQFTRESGQELLNRIIPQETIPLPSVRGISIWRRWRWVAAAVLVFAVGITAAIVVLSDRKTVHPGTERIQITSSDIHPGANRAILSIDNKEIQLSSDKTGITVGEAIAYMDGERISHAGRQLSVTTPNGGQYMVVLPDGTKAWMNAASSISFPAAFPGGKREISVSGEVYLEVARDKSKPFLVDINGISAIEVLGTSFNINAYSDEGRIVTTLVDGSIKVLDGIAKDDAASSVAKAAQGRETVQPIILRPGQQAIQLPNSTGKIIISDANIEQALAWKNGIFYFENADVKALMRQIARWYDIRVDFQGELPELAFRGEMNREVPLSDVLQYLNSLNLDCRLDGRTLIIKGR